LFIRNEYGSVLVNNKIGGFIMKMTFRWYGKDNDKITLEQIRQIPGMQGVVWALFDVPVGDVWPLEKSCA